MRLYVAADLIASTEKRTAAHDPIVHLTYSGYRCVAVRRVAIIILCFTNHGCKSKVKNVSVQYLKQVFRSIHITPRSNNED